MSLILVVAPQLGDLSLVIENVRNERGSVLCSLFASAEGFPDISKSALSNITMKAVANETRCHFKNLEPGRYAASVLHDENDNAQMDSNFLGIPREGYGASLNQLPKLSKQKFEPNEFELKAGETKVLKIKLRYW